MPNRLPRRCGLAVLFLVLATCCTTFADPPAGYYDSVDITTPESCRLTLHAVIDGHTKIPYTSSSTDTWDVLKLADQDPLDAGRILDLYRNRSYLKEPGGNNYYNREHSWPNSYGFPDDGSSNKPYSDCHHLFLCDIGYNGDRGSRIFDDCLSGCTVRLTDLYNGESGQNLYKDATPIGIWETWGARRGDVARAQFYMDVRYEGDAGEPDLILTDDPYLILSCQTGNNEPVGYMGLLTTLVEWHYADPVDDRERNRNDRVFTYQGNRNPFIDHPEWVTLLFDDNPLSALPERGGPSRIAGIAPNPFNPITRITFVVTEPAVVSLELFSLEGKRVRTLLQEFRSVGEHAVTWNGRDEAGRRVGSGAYLCRLQAGDRTDTRKVLLLE